LLKSLTDDAARTAYVKPHEAFTAGAKHFAIVECQMSLVNEKTKQFIMRQMQVTAVQPYQETGLRTQRMYLRNMLTAIILYKPYVVFQIADELAAPLLPFPESGHGDNGCKEVGRIKLAGFQPTEELAAQLLIRNNGITADDAGNIERLRRRTER
jgi:hypothetical protein